MSGFEFSASLEDADLDQYDVDVHDTGFVWDSVERATRATMQRLEYELLAAWRMGYDFCYVWTDHQSVRGSSGTVRFNPSMGVLPSNDPDWQPGMGIGAAERYDLRELSRKQVRAVRNSD